MPVKDSVCMVPGKYCDWGWDMETEGKVVLSEENWFDRFTPLLHTGPRAHTYTHIQHSRTSLWRHEGLRLNLRRKSLNAGCWAKRADENNILLNQLLFFLSALLSIHLSPHEFQLLSRPQSFTLSVFRTIYFSVVFHSLSPSLRMQFLAYCPLSQMAADLGDVSLCSPHMEPLR